jgi:hypothetical protein
MARTNWQVGWAAFWDEGGQITDRAYVEYRLEDGVLRFKAPVRIKPDPHEPQDAICYLSDAPEGGNIVAVLRQDGFSLPGGPGVQPYHQDDRMQ